MAQLAFDINQALRRQAQEQANATARFKQKAFLQAEHMANYMSAKQAAASKEAQTASTTMQQRDE